VAAKPLLATELAAEHATEILRLEKEAMERTYKVYEEARERIMGRLQDVRADTFTAQKLRHTQAQIDKGIMAMLGRLDADAVSLTEQSVQTGIDQMLAQIAQWETEFRGGASVPLAHDAIQKVLKPQGLVLDAYQSSINAYGTSLIADTRRRLAVHMAMESTWGEMSEDIAGALSENMITGAHWRAERIVRTEMIDALSAGHQAGLEAAEEFLPGLQRQWDSTLDERTSGVCRALNGEVRGLHEPWIYQGEVIMRPPALPNCRSRILPYHQNWVDDEEEYDEEEEKKEEKKEEVEPKAKRRGRRKRPPVGRMPEVDRPAPVEMTREEAVAIIRNEVPENVHIGWFRNEDKFYKQKIAEAIEENDRIRSAALNLFYQEFEINKVGKSWGSFKPSMDFETFLNTEITLYRGGSIALDDVKDVFFSYSYDKRMAQTFADKLGVPLRTIRVTPRETWGMMQTIAEGEVLVPIRLLGGVSKRAPTVTVAKIRKAKKSAKESLKLVRSEFVEGVAEGADSLALRSGLFDAIERVAKFEGLRVEDEAFWIANRFARITEEGRQGQVRVARLQAQRLKAQKDPNVIPNAKKTGIVNSESKWMGLDGNYVPERLTEHRRWAEEMRFVDPETGKVAYRLPGPNEEKVYLGMGGASGTGKGTSLRSGQVKKPKNAPTLNSDDAKMRTPEFKAGAKKRDRRVSPFVHEESSEITRRAMVGAFKDGQSIVLDGTGDGGLGSVRRKVLAAKERGYRTIGEYHTCSIEEATERAIFREIRESRGVPDWSMAKSHRQVSRDFLDFKDLGWYDELRLWDTSVEFGQEARLVYERVGGVETIHDKVLWGRFKAKANAPDFVKPTSASKVKAKLLYETIEQEIKDLGRTEAATRRAAVHTARLKKLEDAAKKPVADVVSPVQPKAFVPQLEKSTRGKYGEFLSPATEKGLVKEKALTFLSSDGQAGYALTAEGDFRHAFNRSSRKGEGPKLLEHAKAQAADMDLDKVTLDAFDGFLTKFYRENGFVETSRMKWDDAYAPAGWDYERFGRPDVVNMEYTIKSPKKKP